MTGAEAEIAAGVCEAVREAARACGADAEPRQSVWVAIGFWVAFCLLAGWGGEALSR